jgi:hypothetical protein
MKSFIMLGSFLAAQLISHAASASLLPGIKLGVPDYGGSGCPAGTASVVLSPDEDEISILFDQFIAEAGGGTGRMVDRKACDLGIPIHIPQGYSVAVVQTDFRGFNLVSYGGMNRLNTEYFWANQRGPVYSKMYRGPQNEDYFTSNGVMASGVVWTPCGMDTNRSMDQSMMTVDSADISSGLIYHVQWRECR